jgi:hypothetical protein
MRVELVNSLTPYGANLFILTQLGQIYGVEQGLNTNTSVYVVFSGPVGWPIQAGFTVGDGTYQYVVQDGGIIEASGSSQPLYCVATVEGTWAVPPNTVTQQVTSVPSGVSLTWTNPTAGTPSAGPQSPTDYRAEVLQAGLAASQGMARYLKTLLANVPGVQSRLVSVVQIDGGGWEVIVGGGDPYAVAYAIYSALFDISTLVGSTIEITGATNANPGVYTTNLNHGLTEGQTATVAGASPSGFNHTGTVHVISATTFDFVGFDTTGAGAYVSGGVLTPNTRNLTVNISDYPDIYSIPIVLPPQQTVTLSLLWNTTASNVISNAAVSQLGGPALAAYINSVAVGAPMNLYSLQDTFKAAWIQATSLPGELLTRMAFTVSINGNVVAPVSGTGEIVGDLESYFFATSAGMVIAQG